jgi:hypothetical protein
MSEQVRQLVLKRIAWLRQKEAEQRRVEGPDYTASDLLRGRTQGEIGALMWLLATVQL